jgi:hypothetical protein
MTSQAFPVLGAVCLRVDPQIFPRTSLLLGGGCCLLAVGSLALVLSAHRPGALNDTLALSGVILLFLGLPGFFLLRGWARESKRTDHLLIGERGVALVEAGAIKQLMLYADCRGFEVTEILHEGESSGYDVKMGGEPGFELTTEYRLQAPQLAELRSAMTRALAG